MRTILIVDDDESVRMSLHQFLQDKGYFCEEVDNGAKALDWVLGHEVILVITDNQMPVMNGLEFLKALRSSPLIPPPVIFMTGNSSEALRQEARKAGACATLLKPYDQNDLLMTVRDALPTRREKQNIYP